LAFSKAFDTGGQKAISGKVNMWKPIQNWGTVAKNSPRKGEVRKDLHYGGVAKGELMKGKNRTLFELIENKHWPTLKGGSGKIASRHSHNKKGGGTVE